MKGIFDLKGTEEVFYEDRGVRGVSTNGNILDDHAAINIL